MFLSGSGVQSRMVPLHISFGTIQAYYAAFTDTMPLSPVIFPASSAFTYPCEAVSFNNDYSTMYFTNEVRKIVLKKFIRQPIALPQIKKLKNGQNHLPHWIFAPAAMYTPIQQFSADESFMIFASDKDGSTADGSFYKP
jgi:hypothetical protein